MYIKKTGSLLFASLVMSFLQQPRNLIMHRSSLLFATWPRYWQFWHVFVVIWSPHHGEYGTV